MNIKAAKLQLQEALSGPNAKYWAHGPAVKALMDELNRIEARNAELEATCGALAADNSGLKNFIDSDCWVYDEKQQKYRDAAGRKPEIPTTKFFIGETLAQGVDEAISHIPNILPPTQDAQAITGALRYLARAIRQEAAQ